MRLPFGSILGEGERQRTTLQLQFLGVEVCGKPLLEGACEQLRIQPHHEMSSCRNRQAVLDLDGDVSEGQVEDRSIITGLLALVEIHSVDGYLILPLKLPPEYMRYG